MTKGRIPPETRPNDVVAARKRSGRGLVRIVSLPFALILAACTYDAPARRPIGPASSSVASAAQILPSDLDVVLWLDVARLKQLWLREPERQLLAVLHEYGLVPSTDDYNDGVFWSDALLLADRMWIACRPKASGCHDPVVLLRGDYRRIQPRHALSRTNPPLDLGGGWLRYDRTLRATRSTLSRLYYAPPDRLLAVSESEIDAVERTLERSRGGQNQIPKEAGLVSLLMRPSGIAKVLEPRSPAAARFLREATRIEIEVLPEEGHLALVADLTFETTERAERASTIFRLLQAAFAESKNATLPPDSPVEVQGTRLVLHINLAAPSSPREGDASPQIPAEQRAP